MPPRVFDEAGRRVRNQVHDLDELDRGHRLLLPSLRGGITAAISLTPAICAGITFINSELKSGAVPAGQYTPALATGSRCAASRRGLCGHWRYREKR